MMTDGFPRWEDMIVTRDRLKTFYAVLTLSRFFPRWHSLIVGM
jgi:hypothetical protein